MSKFGTRLINSVKQAKAIARGELTEGFKVHVPEEVDVKAIRARLKLNRTEFAARFGFAVDTVRDWESKRRKPERAARVLLLVIDKEPEAVERALGAA